MRREIQGDGAVIAGLALFALLASLVVIVNRLGDDTPLDYEHPVLTWS
jgi:hypothetical protein